MRRRLFEQFIVRQLLRERARTITTILGIALGVAVVVAIQLTNAASVRGFETALDTVAGKAAIEIAGTGGVDERLLPELATILPAVDLRHVVDAYMTHAGYRQLAAQDAPPPEVRRAALAAFGAAHDRALATLRRCAFTDTEARAIAGTDAVAGSAAPSASVITRTKP